MTKNVQGRMRNRTGHRHFDPKGSIFTPGASASFVATKESSLSSTHSFFFCSRTSRALALIISPPRQIAHAASCLCQQQGRTMVTSLPLSLPFFVLQFVCVYQYSTVFQLNLSISNIYDAGRDTQFVTFRTTTSLIPFFTFCFSAIYSYYSASFSACIASIQHILLLYLLTQYCLMLHFQFQQPFISLLNIYDR